MTDAAARIGTLQRIALKIFLDEETVLDPRDVIPVFHRWIQTSAVDGLLIDVADYSHMTSGPSVLLAAHEGYYAIEQSGGRLGIQYARRADQEGELADRLHAAARTLVKAGRLLETDDTLGGRVRFHGDQLECLANDRLRAPNRGETMEAFRPAFERLLGTMGPDDDWSLTQETDERERLSVRATSDADAALDLLEARLR